MKRGWSPDSIDELYRSLIGQEEGLLTLPSISEDQHLLTSRVRKYYFDSVTKLLCLNYEQCQKMPGKHMRLPSAIWRCAKYIELQAVQACMVMQLYRENILVVIKQLKADTAKGKLYQTLFDCLFSPSSNDKSNQVNFEPRNILIKRRKRCVPEPSQAKTIPENPTPRTNNMLVDNQQYRIPVVVNVQSEVPLSVGSDFVSTAVATQSDSVPPFQASVRSLPKTVNHVQSSVLLTENVRPVHNPISLQIAPQSSHTVVQSVQNSVPSNVNSAQPMQNSVLSMPNSVQPLPLNPVCNGLGSNSNTTQTLVENAQTLGPPQTYLEPNNRLSIESLDAEDQVMLQMEQLFKTDETEDDLFDGAICNDFDLYASHTENRSHDNSRNGVTQTSVALPPVENAVEESVPNTSLDERIAKLKSTGLLAPIPAPKESPQPRKLAVSKWICELYFRRLKLSETLDAIVENNRRKYERIKRKFLELFGEDDEEELMMSPLEETGEFLSSCCERIAPVVVRNLMPYYSKGRIKSKPLFKSVVKHIIDKVIAINRFPDDFEVYTFITSYFKARPVIRCVADYNF